MANFNPYFIRPTNNSGFLQTPNISLGTTWTIESWFNYPLNTQTTWNTFVRGSVSDHQIIVQRSNMHLGMYDNATSTNFNDTGYAMSALSTGAHHIAVVGALGKQLYYIDGNFVGQTVRQSTTDIKSIGGYYGDATQTWGDFDEFRVWNVARTQDQIKQYMNRSLIGNETGLIAYYRCDEGTGTVINDSSVYGKTGILVGTNTWVTGTVSLSKMSKPNIDIVPTSVFITSTEVKNIQINLNLDISYGNSFVYKILLNNNQIYPSNGYTSGAINLPKTISYTLTSDLLSFGENSFIIEIMNDSGLVYDIGDYIIRKENKDTVIMQRYIYSPNEWNKENGINIDINGARLLDYGNNIFMTTDNTNINTIGKSNISSIQINGVGDNLGNFLYTAPFTNKMALGSGYVSDYELDLNRWSTINSISITAK